MTIASNFANGLITAEGDTELKQAVIDSFKPYIKATLFAPSIIAMHIFSDNSLQIMIFDKPHGIELIQFEPEDEESLISWFLQNPHYGQLLNDLASFQQEAHS